RNDSISPGAGDRVALVTYDALDAEHAPQVVLPLSADYDAAMSASTTLQATSDVGSTTATEAGISLARSILKTTDEGGQGRRFAKKVIVLLTDGVPNAWSTSELEIEEYIGNNPSDEYYDVGYVWYNAALMQASLAEAENTQLFPVGMGLGADYDFMDRMARMSTTDEGGSSVRGSGNPAEYETRLTEIFTEIIKRPGSRLVE
ncbi:MAG: VWA domain-containing protein, partial [Planctomycetaceae bacterium]|nr:VWA domain-containing protein [Planctomycetaceae bacterium]